MFAPITQHGLEKYNDAMTKDYFHSTVHQGEQALIQIMQKQNRISQRQGCKMTKASASQASKGSKKENKELQCS